MGQSLIFCTTAWADNWESSFVRGIWRETGKVLGMKKKLYCCRFDSFKYLSYLRVISSHYSTIKIRNEKQFARFFHKGQQLKCSRGKKGAITVHEALFPLSLWIIHSFLFKKPCDSCLIFSKDSDISSFAFVHVHITKGGGLAALLRCKTK